MKDIIQLFATILPKIVEGLVVSFLLFVIGKFCSIIIRHIRFPSPEYRITGFWFAEHGSDYNIETQAIEVYRFYQSGEKIKYRLEQYTSTEMGVFHFCGQGILRNARAATYYYSIDKDSEQIGIMDFELKKKTVHTPYLKSTFHEIEDRKKVCKNGRSDDYRIYPLRLSKMKKFKFHLLHQTFANYSDAKQHIDSLGV